MNYKKYILIAAIALLGTTVINAQTSNVTNAIFSLKAAKEKIVAEDFAGAAKELAEAIAEIEPATVHDKTAGKEKTWRKRAEIYEMIARNSEKPEFASLANDPVSVASASYQKAIELDTKGAYEVENKRGLLVMQNLAMRNGIDKFNAEDYSGAFEMFKKSEELSMGMGLTDTLAIYNAALSAERAKDYDNSITYYKKAIASGYGQAKGEVPGLYIVMSDLHRAKGDTAMAEQTIAEGLELYPNDQGLLIETVNLYLGKNQLDKALDVLKQTLAQDPENANLQYSVGAVYDNLGQKDEAREAYMKAIELNPEYFDPNYNLGASYYNEAVELINEANAIPTNQTTKYNAAKAKADEVLFKAVPYLERAHELDPEDQGTMASLAESYARTNQLEKRKEIMTKLGK